jgi:hypothetical protein
LFAVPQIPAFVIRTELKPVSVARRESVGVSGIGAFKGVDLVGGLR